MLSKCSLALILNVAIELVRISALCMVIFNASFDGNKAAPAPASDSASGLLISGGGGGGLLSPLGGAFGGETDDDGTKRIPLAANRAPCDDGDIVRFCGEGIGGIFVATDVGIGTGGGKWLGGV